jgi:hypothetical protein
MIFNYLFNNVFESGRELHFGFECGDQIFEMLFRPVELIFALIFCVYSAWAIFLTASGLVRKGLNK